MTESTEWSAFTSVLAARVDRALASVRAHAITPDDRLAFRPANGGWSNAEIAEHVVLVNRYLLILVEKIARKCAARASRGDRPPAHPPRTEHLEKLARREFDWRSPEHMLPKRTESSAVVAAALEEQRTRCARMIAELGQGEGSLHTIRMSVVGDDDRLDLYQFILVIALHAERHARAMERNAAEFDAAARA
jgi:DinB superfamily